jgi:NitT/TauT family transport system ATP-binding protein
MWMTQTAEWRRKQSDDSASAPGPVLDLRCVCVRYLTKSGLNTAVADISVKVEPGEFVSVVGPSGCGKSTLLHVAAGLIRPAAGKVRYLGQEWAGLHPDVGYVTQKDTLLPWKSVIDNLALPLQLKGVRRSERRQIATEMAENLGLEKYLKHFPAQLSGGMRQRVQLGRTLVIRPKLLLMDEPFGALDAYLRLRMQELLLSILRGHPVSTVFVTHDLGEAISLSDRVLALAGSPGRLGLDCAIKSPVDRNDLMAMRSTQEFTEYQTRLWEVISAPASAGGAK